MNLLIFAILVHFLSHGSANSYLTGVEIELPVRAYPGLRFILLGDWGKGGLTGAYASVAREKTSDGEHPEQFITEAAGKSLYQVAVARAMGRFVATSTIATSFILALGDNFYDNGVPSADSMLWNYLWKDVYLQYAGLNIPWYPIFGNHDYTGGSNAVQAQLERTQVHADDDIWRMESTNYTKRFEFQSGNEIISVGIVFVDTTTLAPNQCNKCNYGLSNDMKQMLITNQLSHIDSMLAEYEKNPVTWLLVAGHYPIYSNGAHGDMSELISVLQPLLEKYHVHAYLAGHDHFHAHLQKKEIEYFIAGAGSMLDSPKYTSAAALVWSNANIAGFAYIDASETDLTIGYVSTANETIYSYSLQNPGPTKKITSAGAADDDHQKIKASPSTIWEDIQSIWESTSTQEMELTVAMSSVCFIGLSLFVWRFFKASKRTVAVEKEKDKKHKKQRKNSTYEEVSYHPVQYEEYSKSLFTSALTTETSSHAEDTVEDPSTMIHFISKTPANSPTNSPTNSPKKHLSTELTQHYPHDSSPIILSTRRGGILSLLFPHSTTPSPVTPSRTSNPMSAMTRDEIEYQENLC